MPFGWFDMKRNEDYINVQEGEDPGINDVFSSPEDRFSVWNRL